MHAQTPEDSTQLGAVQPLTNMVTILLEISLIVQLDVQLKFLVKILSLSFYLFRNNDE